MHVCELVHVCEHVYVCVYATYVHTFTNIFENGHLGMASSRKTSKSGGQGRQGKVEEHSCHLLPAIFLDLPLRISCTLTAPCPQSTPSATHSVLDGGWVHVSQIPILDLRLSSVHTLKAVAAESGNCRVSCP